LGATRAAIFVLGKGFAPGAVFGWSFDPAFPPAEALTEFPPALVLFFAITLVRFTVAIWLLALTFRLERPFFLLRRSSDRQGSLLFAARRLIIAHSFQVYHSD
jgi:hypothetical protein